MPAIIVGDSRLWSASWQKYLATGAIHGRNAPLDGVLSNRRDLVGVPPFFVRNCARLCSFVGVPREGIALDGESSVPNFATAVRTRPDARLLDDASGKMLSRWAYSFL